MRIRSAATRAFPGQSKTVRSTAVRECSEAVEKAEEKMKNKLAFRACWMLLTLFTLISCSQPATIKTPKAPPVPHSQSSPNSAKPERKERLVIACDGEDGKTALEILKTQARIRTTTFQFGDQQTELVVEINGIAAGNGFDFLYFVNGTMSKTAAGNYATKTGDKIEWKLVGPRKQ